MKALALILILGACAFSTEEYDRLNTTVTNTAAESASALESFAATQEAHTQALSALVREVGKPQVVDLQGLPEPVDVAAIRVSVSAEIDRRVSDALAIRREGIYGAISAVQTEIGERIADMRGEVAGEVTAASRWKGSAEEWAKTLTKHIGDRVKALEARPIVDLTEFKRGIDLEYKLAAAQVDLEKARRIAAEAASSEGSGMMPDSRGEWGVLLTALASVFAATRYGPPVVDKIRKRGKGSTE